MPEDAQIRRLAPRRQGVRPRHQLSSSRHKQDIEYPTRLYAITRKPEKLQGFEVTPQSVAEILIPVYGAKRLSASTISLPGGYIYIGNWVVMDSKGIVNVYRSDDFHDRFEVLDADS